MTNEAEMLEALGRENSELRGERARLHCRVAELEEGLERCEDFLSEAMARYAATGVPNMTRWTVRYEPPDSDPDAAFKFHGTGPGAKNVATGLYEELLVKIQAEGGSVELLQNDDVVLSATVPWRAKT